MSMIAQSFKIDKELLNDMKLAAKEHSTTVSALIRYGCMAVLKELQTVEDQHNDR